MREEKERGLGDGGRIKRIRKMNFVFFEKVKGHTAISCLLKNRIVGSLSSTIHIYTV